MRRVGIIGGMSWESTRLYYEAINRGVSTRLGGLHSAELLIASLDFAPIAAMQAAGQWDAAGEILGGAAARLEAAGATAIALATNTMHKCAPQIRARIGVRFLHIAEAVCAALEQDGRSAPLLLGTRFTMEDGFLRDLLSARGLTVHVPSPQDRAEIHAAIFGELCLGIANPKTRRKFSEIIEIGGIADCVILGCTELGMVVDSVSSNLPVYDTAKLHAEAIVDYMLGGEDS